MRSLYNYIIFTKERYNNKKDLEGKELILNTEITERDFHFVNRIGKVVSTPINIKTPIQSGDDVIIHHNVFRRWLNQQQEERNSASYLDEDKYTVAADQVFAYKTFGLRYDQVNRIWRVIINENLNVNDAFSNGKTGDVTNNKLDASWIILFQTNGEKYTVTNRGLRYVSIVALQA